MTERGRTSALGRLYDSVTRANGWSMREVSERISERSSGSLSLSKSRIGQIVGADRLDSINVEVIDCLATGLNVAPDRVARAVVESMGFRLPGDDLTPAEAIDRDESLSADTKAALLAILRTSEGRRGA